MSARADLVSDAQFLFGLWTWIFSCDYHLATYLDCRICGIAYSKPQVFPNHHHLISQKIQQTPYIAVYDIIRNTLKLQSISPNIWRSEVVIVDRTATSIYQTSHKKIPSINPYPAPHDLVNPSNLSFSLQQRIMTM